MKTKKIFYLFFLRKNYLFINILIILLLFSLEIFASASDGTLIVISGGSRPSSNYSYYIKDVQNAYKLFKPLTASDKRFYFIADGGEGTSANFTSVDEEDPKPLKYAKDGTSSGSNERFPEAITGAAKESVIKKKFKDLQNMDDDNKPLYIYITDHGDQDSSSLESRIILWGNEVMSVADLRESLSKIPSKRSIVLVNEQCFGGGMLEALRLADGSFRANSCGFASSSELEPSTSGLDRFGNRKDNLISIFNKRGARTFAEKFKMVGGNILSHPVSSRDIFCKDYLKEKIDSRYPKYPKKISKRKGVEFQKNHANYQVLNKLKKQIEGELKDYLKDDVNKDLSIYRYKREQKTLYVTLQEQEKKYLELSEKNDEIRGAFLTSDKSYERYNLLKQDISDKKNKNVEVKTELQKEFKELNEKFTSIKKNMDEIEKNCDYKFDNKYKEKLDQMLIKTDSELEETIKIREEKEAELDTLKNEIEVADKDIKSKEKDLIESMEDEKEKEKKANQLKEKIKKLDSDLIKSKSSGIDKIKKELEERENEKKKLKDEGRKVAWEYEKAANKLEDKQKKLRILNKKNKTQNDSDLLIQIKELETEVTKLKEKVDILDANLKKITDSIDKLDAEDDEINIIGKQLEQAENYTQNYERAQEETARNRESLSKAKEDTLKLKEKQRTLEEALVLAKTKEEQDKKKLGAIEEHTKAIKELHTTVELAKMVFSSPLITENVSSCSSPCNDQCNDPCNDKFHISKDKDVTLMQYGLYISKCFDKEKLCLAKQANDAYKNWKEEIEKFKPKRDFIDKLGQYQTIKHILEHFDKKEERDLAKQLLGIVKCEEQIVDSR
ncbi:MAG: hypothetical protein HQK51_11635 [Oligoflexia bacterium]|nr:hypothetical protein [Oligoflexia bacterium]